MIGHLTSHGDLTVRKIPRKRAPISWRIRNGMRPAFWLGCVAVKFARLFSYWSGIPTMTSELRIRHNRGGKAVYAYEPDGPQIEIIGGVWTDYGVVGYRSITTAFVGFVTDQLQTETSVFGDFKFHDSGVGTTAENVSNTAMETTDGESRATGTQTESSANVYVSVGTIAYTTTKAITEHGLFNDASAGTLMDRTVFSAINVVNGDSIQFTYSHTFNSGG